VISYALIPLVRAGHSGLRGRYSRTRRYSEFRLAGIVLVAAALLFPYISAPTT